MRATGLSSLLQLLLFIRGAWAAKSPQDHPAYAPASFNCSMRKLAYEFGKELLPRYGKFESLYYALGLNVDCSVQMSLGPEVPAPLSEAIPEGAFFVDPVHGSDGFKGTETEPKRTVQAAVNMVARRSGVVVLRGGVHYLDQPLQLGPQHSGLTIRYFPGEIPVISGGKHVTVNWTAYDVQLGDEGRNIYKANIKGQVSDVPGLQLNGVRATRARYPNLPGGIEVSPGYGSLIDGGQAVWTPPQFAKLGKVTYYEDDSPAHLRNITPDDWFQRYKIGTNGFCSVYDPPVSYWCSEHPQGGLAFPYRTPSGVAPKSSALPKAPYKDPSQLMFFIWRPRRWESWMFEVGDYKVTPEAPAGNYTFGRGGFQGARGENVGGDFFVENVFEELDNPGEFFYNESTGDLFLYYNGTGAPPQDMEVVVPHLRVLVNISGTPWDPVHDITIDGVTFMSSRHTYMEPHGVPSGGDWALERTGAIFLEGTERVTLQNCSFKRLDGHGLFISGYNRNATVQDSAFEFIGGSAMASWGYTNETENSGFPYYRPNTNYPMAGVDGTDGNHPLGTRVLRNLVREVGLYEKQNSFWVQAKTARTTIHGNVFFNGPRAGINANDGFGGGDVISHNLVFSTCRESSDHGPFNSWDRQPYLTSVRTGAPSMIMEWREIHHNFLIDNYSPQEGVDNDDGSTFYRTHDNFMVYGVRGMKNDYGGHDNRHWGNIYAYVGIAMRVNVTLKGHEDYFFRNKVVLTSSDAGGVMCTEPKTQLWDNEYFTPTGEITECGRSLVDVQAIGMDRGSTVKKIPSDDAIIGWARELLFMHPEKPNQIFV
mmetsp:Transcript_55434/g.172019  ORF Transcript_55434/g.172019 Transcript_55434/m.172019 type:complete len:820 (-) Transcript_55434:96-2555(-)